MLCGLDEAPVGAMWAQPAGSGPPTDLARPWTSRRSPVAGRLPIGRLSRMRRAAASVSEKVAKRPGAGMRLGKMNRSINCDDRLAGSGKSATRALWKNRARRSGAEPGGGRRSTHLTESLGALSLLDIRHHAKRRGASGWVNGSASPRRLPPRLAPTRRRRCGLVPSRSTGQSGRHPELRATCGARCPRTPPGILRRHPARRCRRRPRRFPQRFKTSKRRNPATTFALFKRMTTRCSVGRSIL